MNSKQEYLDSLQKQLQWNYDAKEVLEILHDYNEFFDTAIEQGKTEQEICVELGSPEDLVSALASEGKKAKFKKRMIGCATGMFIILYILYQFFFTAGVYYHKITYCYFISFLLPVFIWKVLKGKEFSLNNLTKENKNKVYIQLISAHVFLAVLGMGLYFSLYQLNLSVISHPERWVSVASYIGPMVHNVFCISIVGVFCLILWALKQYRKYSISFYSVICHGIGVIASILCCEVILHSLDLSRASGEFLWTEKVYLPYMGCILIAILFLIYDSYMQRRKRVWMHK